MGISGLFMRVGVLSLVCGVGLGIYMGAADAFQFKDAHAHLNLAGWASMMLFGFFYRLFPDRAAGWPAKLHAALSIAGLVMMIGGLVGLEAGFPAAIPVMVGGDFIFAAGVLVFAFILFGATRGKNT